MNRRLQWRSFAGGMFLIHGFLGAAESTPATTPPAPRPNYRPWPSWAKRLTGESAPTRTMAIVELRKIPTLSAQIIKALDGPDRPLALDVISALELKSLVPELLKKARQDMDGFLVLTINSLLNSTNRVEIGEVYIQHLTGESAPDLAPGAVMAMLEMLGRMKVRLPPATLKNLLTHAFPEVGLSVVQYLRQLGQEEKTRKYRELIGRALQQEPYQLRVQALYLIQEWGAEEEFVEALRSCESDPQILVQTPCRQALARTKKDPKKES